MDDAPLEEQAANELVQVLHISRLGQHEDRLLKARSNHPIQGPAWHPREVLFGGDGPLLSHPCRWAAGPYLETALVKIADLGSALESVKYACEHATLPVEYVQLHVR